MKKTIIVGSRKSELAVAQTKFVVEKLKQLYPEKEFKIVTMTTKGDKILNKTLSKVGGKGLFVKEIEEALLSSKIDLAVHSLKDMPYELPPGLVISAVTKREDPRDVLISKYKESFFDLNDGAKVGTSSLRRAAQIKGMRSDINIVPIRGNVNTRIRKMHELNLDAIVLAAAGIKRLNMEDIISYYFPCDVMIPAVGQGALAIEMREGDKLISIVKKINCKDTQTATTAERSFMRELGGSCKVPIGAYGKVFGDKLELWGMVEIDGKLRTGRISGRKLDAYEIGIKLAERLREE